MSVLAEAGSKAFNEPLTGGSSWGGGSGDARSVGGAGGVGSDSVTVSPLKSEISTMPTIMNARPKIRGHCSCRFLGVESVGQGSRVDVSDEHNRTSKYS